jgi:hypothetical protein
MDGNYRYIGGQWVPAEPVKQGVLFRIEMLFRRHHHKHIASLLAWWDERKLGK